MELSLSHGLEKERELSMGTRNWKGWLAVAGVAAVLWPAAVVTAWADEDLAAGTLLVADRKLKDPNFQKAVVLIVTYGEHGTVGLVLNRQSNIPVAQLLGGVKDARDRKDTAFSGGPVEPKSVLALLRANKGPEGAQRIAGDIWALLDEDLLQDTLATHPGPDKLRFYVGYAGWGPGQLESEMEAGAWRVIRANSDTVFDGAPDSLWDRVVRDLDLSLAWNKKVLYGRPSAAVQADASAR
jgi:putative transcriptional regulator